MKPSNKTTLHLLIAALFLGLLLYPAICIAQMPIGVSAPLTGELAEYGAAVRNGIELAKQKQPKQFASVRFVYGDNKYHAKDAVTVFTKLRAAEGVALIYNWGEPTLHAIAPLAERYELPILAMSLDPEPALGRRFIVRTINHSSEYAAAMLRHLRAQGVGRIGVIKTEDPFPNSMVAGLRAHLQPGEQVEEVFSYQPGQTDFKSAIARLKTTEYDAVAVYLFSGQVSAFYRQAAAQGFTALTFGTDFFESEKEIADAAGAMEGALYPNIAVPEEFHAAYKKRFGNDTQIAYAYNAFESALLIAKIAAEAPTARGAKLLDAVETALKQTKDAPYVYRSTKDGGKHMAFAIAVKKIVKGSPIVFQKTAN